MAQRGDLKEREDIMQLSDHTAHKGTGRDGDEADEGAVDEGTQPDLTGLLIEEAADEGADEQLDQQGDAEEDDQPGGAPFGGTGGIEGDVLDRHGDQQAQGIGDAQNDQVQPLLLAFSAIGAVDGDAVRHIEQQEHDHIGDRDADLIRAEAADRQDPEPEVGIEEIVRGKEPAQREQTVEGRPDNVDMGRKLPVCRSFNFFVKYPLDNGGRSLYDKEKTFNTSVK